MFLNENRRVFPVETYAGKALVPILEHTIREIDLTDYAWRMARQIADAKFEMLKLMVANGYHPADYAMEVSLNLEAHISARAISDEVPDGYLLPPEQRFAEIFHAPVGIGPDEVVQVRRVKR